MLREATRYVGVQLLAYAVDYGIYAVGLASGIDPVASNVAGKIAAGGVAFVLHRHLTFRAHGEAVAGQALRYALLLLLNLPLSSAALYVALLWLPPYGAKVVADIACVGITFLLSRALVFRRRGGPA